MSVVDGIFDCERMFVPVDYEMSVRNHSPLVLDCDS